MGPERLKAFCGTPYWLLLFPCLFMVTCCVLALYSDVCLVCASIWFFVFRWFLSGVLCLCGVLLLRVPAVWWCVVVCWWVVWCVMVSWWVGVVGWCVVWAWWGALLCLHGVWSLSVLGWSGGGFVWRVVFLLCRCAVLCVM